MGMIMNNDVEEVSSDKDIEANYNESFSTKEFKNTKFEVMRTTKQESNIHSSDTLPLNMAMPNINELIKTSDANEDSMLSSSILKQERLACLHNRLAEGVRIVRGAVHQRSVERLSGLHRVTLGIAVVLWRPLIILGVHRPRTSAPGVHWLNQVEIPM